MNGIKVAGISFSDLVRRSAEKIINESDSLRSRIERQTEKDEFHRVLTEESRESVDIDPHKTVIRVDYMGEKYYIEIRKRNSSPTPFKGIPPYVPKS